MKGVELESLLVNWTVKHSGLDLHRSYIGLSGIGDCPAAIYDRYTQGQTFSVKEHLKSRLAYELEYALVSRLREMGLYRSAEEISLYGGLVQGHLDGLIRRGTETDLLEIKTVPLAEHIPSRSSRLPERVFWQVQAYLHYGRRMLKLDVDWALVVYMARDSGLVGVRPVRYSRETGMQIDAKVKLLVDAARQRVRPACTCGKHLATGG